jgi:Transposase domain (DUF772)
MSQLFYDFCLDDHVPSEHMLRGIDGFLDLGDVRKKLKPSYRSISRPSIDPELMIRMLIIGYCMGIRSERRLCDEVHLNLAYRWFCRLGLNGKVSDHSTFSRNPNLAWGVKDKKIAPHIPVFDKSNRTDGTFSRADFSFDPQLDRYVCPAGKELIQFRRTSHLCDATFGHYQRGHTALPRQQEGLRRLRTQGEMLPQCSGPENSPRRQ